MNVAQDYRAYFGAEVLHQAPVSSAPSRQLAAPPNELLYDQREDIGYITFNRPLTRNALTFAMYERLAEIATDPGDVRA
jgi:hypothetical protein